MSTPAQPTYTVTLQPLKDENDRQGHRRLRSLLKVALRRFRLRCIKVIPDPHERQSQ